MPTNFNERLVRDLAIGEIRDGAARYLMIRADTLMGLFKRLAEGERKAALEALQASTIENGARSALAYQMALADEDRLQLLDVIAATAPQLGWGSWSFSDVSPSGFALEVRNSPFAAGFGRAPHPVCHAITGMLTASGALALGQAVSARETRCAAAVGEGPCRFEVKVS